MRSKIYPIYMLLSWDLLGSILTYFRSLEIVAYPVSLYSRNQVMTHYLLGSQYHLGFQASKKIADAKLAKDFQAILKEFQKAQRLSAERETAYAPFVPQAVLPSRYKAFSI